jgi:antitoxin YefM
MEKVSRFSIKPRKSVKAMSEMFLREETSLATAQENLLQIIDQVAQKGQVFIIDRPNEENVALIAEADLNSLIETVYLFRSPANARRLLDALDEMKTGKIVPQSIEDLKKELGVDGQKEEEE